MRKFATIFCSALLLAACTKESNPEAILAGAENQSIQNPQITREFSGSFFSTINPDPSLPPMQCTGDLPGLFLPDHFLHGSAIHLGELIWQQSTLHHQSCNLSFATAQLTASVSGQIMASNGDLIYYTGNDTINVLNLLTGQGTTGGLQGTWTITGGTGRFLDASGSFNVSGLVDFTTGTFSAAANGSITY